MSWPSPNLALASRAYPPLVVTISPTSVGGAANTSGTATSAATTATIAGGSGSRTLAWELVSGSALTVNAPTSTTTTFSQTGMSYSSETDAVYRLKVTDLITAEVAYSPNVSVALTRGAAPAPIPMSITPSNPSNTRAGAGVVNFGFVMDIGESVSGSTNYLWNSLTGGATFNGGNQGISVSIAVTLAPGETKSGSITGSLVDNATGRSGQASASWTANAT